jgi:hypothetical protein
LYETKKGEMNLLGRGKEEDCMSKNMKLSCKR